VIFVKVQRVADAPFLSGGSLRARSDPSFPERAVSETARLRDDAKKFHAPVAQLRAAFASKARK